MREPQGPLVGPDDEGSGTRASPSSRRAWLACSADGRVEGTAAAVGAAARESDQLTTARAATAGCHDVDAAVADGRGVLRDALGIACIDAPGIGGMGIHYVKGAIVGDGAIDVSTPEALVYEPQADGRPKLCAVEDWALTADR